MAETREGETNAQLRCTVVWTLSRYIQWVLRQDNDGQYLAPLVERVLNATLDHNKQARRTARLLVASTNLSVRVADRPPRGPPCRSLVCCRCSRRRARPLRPSRRRRGSASRPTCRTSCLTWRKVRTTNHPLSCLLWPDVTTSSISVYACCLLVATGMGRYQTRSLIVLLDTLGTLADSVRQELAKQEYIDAFMPPVSRHSAPTIQQPVPVSHTRRLVTS